MEPAVATTGEGQRFKRIPRQAWSGNLELDPLLNESLDQWPHLNELVQCYKADFVKDDCKYGRYQPVREAVSYRGLFTAGWFGVREKHCSWLKIYDRLRVSEQADESVAPPSFQNQIFEGPDTDIETELQLCNARHSKPEDATEDDTPSTSGRQIYETESSASSSKVAVALIRSSSFQISEAGGPLRRGAALGGRQRVASCAARLHLAAGPRAASQGVRRQAGLRESDDSNMQQEYSIFFSLHLMSSIAEGKKYFCVVLGLVVLHEQLVWRLFLLKKHVLMTFLCGKALMLAVHASTYTVC